MRKSTMMSIAFALVAGAFLGYLLRGPIEGPGTAPTFPAPVADRYEPPRDPGDGADRPAGFRSLAEALESVPIPEFEGGTGRITGHVRLEGGGPLAGVLVRAEWCPPADTRWTETDPAEARDDDSLVREFLQREHLVRSSRVECRTDAQGMFLLDGLANERYLVRGYLEGYTITTRRSGTWQILRPGEPGEFVAKPRVSVPVRVLLPDGEPAATAQILVRVNARVTSHAWTRETTEIATAPGRSHFRATAGPEDRCTSREVEVELIAGQVPEPVVLRVEDLPGIMGKVIPAREEDQQGWRVKIARVPEGTEPSPRLLESAGTTTWVWRSGGATYAFRDLRPGTWLVGLLDRSRKLLDHATVEVGEGMVEQDLRAAGPEPERLLEVRVEGPDGSPVPRAVVRERYRAWTSSWSGAAAVAEGDGTYHLAHREAEAGTLRPGGKYYAEAFTRTWGTARVEYDPERLEPVTIRYEEPARLELTLLDYTDSPWEGNAFLMLTADGEDEGTGHTVTDYGFTGGISPEGVRKYEALQPGGYLLTVWVSTPGGGRFRAAEEGLELERGENRKAIRLPAGLTLTVLVPEPPAGRRYRLEARGGATGTSGPSRAEPESGRVVFPGVPAGSYALIAEGAGVQERMVLTLSGDTTVRFRPEEATALRITIYRRIGYLGRAGFRDGDLVVGIDGKEFETEAAMEAALALARARPSVELTILRDGTRLVLPVDLEKAEDLVESGATLAPCPR